jgi:hypothetical protein
MVRPEFLPRVILSKENAMSKGDTATRTDAACATAGIYRSDCSDQERVTLAVGDTFPRCPSCRKAVGWNLAVAM